MKYFIDTEFHEGFHKSLFGRNRHFINLISIGIVAEDGREYYAISKDFDIKAAWNAHEVIPFLTSKNHSLNDRREYWLRENVLRPIFEEWKMEMNGKIVRLGMPFPLDEQKFNFKNFKRMIKQVGKSNKQIADEIEKFCYHKSALDYKERGNPEFYGYYCDYDWVVFCSLFGKMIDLPKDFPKYCRDLKQMLDEKADETGYYKYDDALMSLDALKDYKEYPKQTNEHNALADAKWNLQLFKFLQSI